MKKILERLFQYETLSTEEAKEILIKTSREEYNSSQVVAFMTVFLMRHITPQELSGFREALLELCIPFDTGNMEAIDLCGTGGDGLNTFNISTIASFVVAGAGYKVVKHGNYGVSSGCGSSNVLEQLGAKFTNDHSTLLSQLEGSNFCFLHAPLFHPALKSVGPLRRELGVKTFFNMLGPLVNPSRPSHQLVGVFSLQLQRLYQAVLSETSTDFCIVHASDGYDEVSLTSKTKIITRDEELLVDTDYFGMSKVKSHDIHGGQSIKEAADIFMNILSGKGSQAQRNVVLANAALAIKTISHKSMEECLSISRESLDNGQALGKLKSFVS